MADDSLVDPPQELTAVFSAVADPELGRRLLPRLLGMVDEDDELRRLGACWAICHVLAVDPDTASYLARRLLDRLEGDPSLEVELLATYVWTRHPETVDEVIQTRADERDDYRYPSIGGPSARAGPLRPEIGDRSVGRTRLPGEGSDPGPQQVYTDDEDHRTERVRGEDDENADDGGRSDTDDEAETSDPLDPSVTAGTYEPPELLSLVTYQSVFDSLSIVAGRHRTRYSDVYRTLGVRDGEEVGVGLALFHRPSTHRDRFADVLSGVLAQWGSIADHDSVVTLYDWNTEPRPWAATEYTDLTLAARGRLQPDLAHWNAVALADALSYAHENGVVHGGIDPGNVAYYGNVLDDSERQPPMLTNVGLMDVVREYFDPTTRLDPRYAAPEYFDRRYGRLDHATDIYHLGAVCYRLFTGQAPFDGEYRDVRRAILEGDRRLPSDVTDVPDGIDDVISKAMATEKLRRYESVAHLGAELRAIGRPADGG
jgi:hypothetical protein